jgi:hypothetical protein
MGDFDMGDGRVGEDREKENGSAKHGVILLRFRRQRGPRMSSPPYSPQGLPGE